MASTPVTRVSLPITDVAVMLDAATMWLKLYRAKQAIRGHEITSNELEDSITRSLVSLKEVIGSA